MYHRVLVIPWILRGAVIMVSKTCVVICFCVGLLVAIQTFLPKAFAYKRTSNVDEFMLEDKRTHMRQNYVVQRALDNEVNNYDYGVPKYSMDSIPAPVASEELPAFIVDYANMIRNDIILLDNSVQTRTRKRGNINVEEHGQQLDAPCICESGAKRINLHKGQDTVYPQSIYNVTCDQSLCHSRSHSCKERIIHVKILRMRDHPVYEKQLNNSAPEVLRFKWMNDTVPIVTGCICMRKYLKNPSDNLED
ncbi:prothoracicotropic hormone-like [Choristoneura fumiferana]|uniref:prothoracicotropic hormone-like n=1 Tax=Choristoneura fumiferana TaxID=7141 RepID=UPI003D155B7C